MALIHQKICMNIHFKLLLLASIFPFLPLSSWSSYSRRDALAQGSSLSPLQDFLLSSPSAIFTAGFYQVGENAFHFAVWFSDPLADGSLAVVWMANRDRPVNERNTKLSLSDTGNLVLTDAGQFDVWTSGTESRTSVQLKLHDSGNLLLIGLNGGVSIWESFDSPTNTILPQQYLTRATGLVSSRSQTNYSSGLYKLFFDNDNVLRLMYDSVLITSVFWPSPWLNSWEAGRTSYNDSKIAVLDLSGFFLSSDIFEFRTSDYGLGVQRRMSLDHDGNVRVYSLDRGLRIWKVTWQAIIEPCKVHGICGVNSLCTYGPGSTPKCTCLPRHKMKNDRDWSEGCVPEFEFPCNGSTDSAKFFQYNHVEFYGYDIGYYPNITLDECKRLCLSYCNCKGFQYKFEWIPGFYTCFPKSILFNGYQSSGFEYWFYLKVPKSWPSSDQELGRDSIGMRCTSPETQLDREYKKKKEHGWLKPLLWCAVVVGAFETMCVLIFLYKTNRRSSPTEQGYMSAQAMGGFRRFTYAELKKASRSFSEEIGEGGSGVVYKGMLQDGRIAAIKSLHESKMGEAEFLAEVSLIGRLNHGNLIEAWGYCSERKHRLLVYAYMENGSLAENLYSNKLDWKKRFEIAVGTAKGLSYLHEECLEWVLHCDVKPENILLDSNYQAKVSDFGMSKLISRSSMENLSFSRIRGTRGYMAPEWVSRQPITSKADVYSYGMVVLEMITGKNPKMPCTGSGGKEETMVDSVMELISVGGGVGGSLSWIEKIVDPSLGSEYDFDRLQNLMKVGLKCAQGNKEERPVMREVVDMLIHQESFVQPQHMELDQA